MITILSFFNDCSLQELTSVPTLSAKKAEKIIKMRPFDSWNDLVRTFLLTNNMLYPDFITYIICRLCTNAEKELQEIRGFSGRPGCLQ